MRRAAGFAGGNHRFGPPAPASALLSALVLKGSFYVLLRLWFDVFPTAELEGVGRLLGALGAAAILWGSVQAIRQRRLKRMVAYSTVAQAGYLFFVFALTAQSSTSWNAWRATAFFALSHACAKAAAFMAAGSLRYATGSDEIDKLAGTAQQQPATVFAFALAGVGLMGLPPSGSFFAKWVLLDAAIATGQWVFAVIILLGGLLAAVYVFRVLAKAFVATETAGDFSVPMVMQLTPLVLAFVSLGLGGVAAQGMELLEVGSPPLPTNEGKVP